MFNILRYYGKHPLSLFFLWAFCITHPAVQPHAQENGTPQPTVAQSEADNPQYENWRNVLRYGIEEQILDVLATLTMERIEGFEQDVYPLLSSQFSDDLLSGVIRYLDAIADYAMAAQIADILREREGRHTDALLLQALSYIASTPPHELPANATEAIRSLTTDSRVLVARGAIDTLAIHGDESDMALLNSLINDELAPSDVRGSAILAVGALNMTDNLNSLHRILEDEEVTPYLRQYAATAIGNIASETSLPILINLSRDENSRVRKSVIEAFAQYQQPEAEEALKIALRDSNGQARLAATRAFEKRTLDDETIASLQYKILHDPEYEVQLASAMILATYQGADGLGYIREQLYNPRITFALRTELVALLVIHDYPNSSMLLTEFISNELEHKRRSTLLTSIARRLARLDVSNEATELYSLLLTSVDPNTVSYALQGINLNDAQHLRGQLYNIVLTHQSSNVRNQAQMILDQWASE